MGTEVDFFKKSYPKRTVCEVTREIYEIITKNKHALGEILYNEIFKRLVDQMKMQKKMDAKLKAYKDTYEDDYELNPDWEEKKERRETL